jgi:hypothetical protein
MIAYKVSKNAKVLFVGINPHPGSYRRGVPFSNNKMFWYLLNRAGLLDEAERDLKEDESLKQLYDSRFVLKYALNFVNLVDRPTIEVRELEKGEEKAGVRLRLAEEHREREGLSDAFSDPGSSVNPREGAERSETSQRTLLAAAEGQGLPENGNPWTNRHLRN